MQGAGNDYIYINGFEAIPPHLSSLAVKMSDRHFGVGSDGLVMIVPSKTCDFGMRMFNADGTEAEMCGNAARCVGKYLYDHGMTDKTELTLETLAGVKRIYLTVAHGRVTSVKVDMGEPRLLPGDLPVLLPGDRVVAQPIEVCGHRFSMTCVSMGNPHAVIFLDDLQAYDLHAIGRAIEHHELFPRRTNVEFVKVLAPDVLQMRVWERGAGEILFTSMNHDGTRSGYPCETFARLADMLSIPVIASGGAGSVADMADVLTKGRADAALAASIFHYGEITIGDLKRQLKQMNINVRI